MHQQDRFRIARTFIDVVDPDLCSILVAHRCVMRRIVEVGQVGEAIIGCSKDFHALSQFSIVAKCGSVRGRSDFDQALSLILAGKQRCLQNLRPKDI
jgi:hypothetical protein